MNNIEREQLRLMRQYNIRKFKELQNTLNILIDFARDDLKKLDKLEDLKDEK